MPVSRRNTLIGLGALVGGTGALAASGAFTAVEAERDVSIATAGDDSALLEIVVDDTYDGLGSDGPDDTISLDLEGLNRNAITTFEGALTITPGAGATGSYDIDVFSDFGQTDSVTYDAAETDEGDAVFQLVQNDGPEESDNSDGSYSGIGAGDDVVYDLVINLRNITAENPDLGLEDDSIVIWANDAS